jgi:hypothetical protein
MADEAEELINELLTGVVMDLDVPPALEATVHGLYDDVGRFMCEALDEGEWSIHPQGSGRLGTMVRRHDSEDYDIDSVVVRDVPKERITQNDLKATVGEVLEEYVIGRTWSTGPRFTSVTADRRCFTLESDDPIHMDVLPAVPDRSSSPTALWIPDRELRLWQPSDPVGFGDWFFDQMSAQMIEAKAAFAKRAHVDVEDVPNWQVRTILQRAVQVLKAHRNCYFEPHDPNHASSIVITATAARAYRGESSLLEAVMNAAALMPRFIEKDGPTYVVLNPAHPDENFADLWTAARAAEFFAWIDDLQRTLEEAAKGRSGLHRTADALGSRFGIGPVTKAVERLGLQRTAARNEDRLTVASTGLIGATGVSVKRHTFHGT